ncbi:hypothetical protein BaRGS_00017204 [Batillaria attramentaria]|uniref:Major facilitator superfamily (MFS) profile domain-containing protein n=1 Tax=Batillaria attramentaria TaxID=370345 RepID=A0ABD0KWX7_9CAEN
MAPFDEVLEKTGQFGVYQKRLLCLVCLTAASVILQNLAPVFTMNLPRHRCKLPEYPNDTYSIQSSYHQHLINVTIPTTDGAYSECTLHDANLYYNGSDAQWKVTECSEWVYDKSTFESTITTQLNLVCRNKIYRSHSNMMIFVGKISGALINSVGGDSFGRRRVFMLLLLPMLACAVGLVFVNSLPALMILRFFIGATSAGCYLCNVVIVMELVGPAYRRWAQVGLEVSSISINLLATLFAYLLRDWRHFQAVVAAPCLPLLLGYIFVPESPRWLVSKGRLAEAQKIVDAMARANGTSPAPTLDTDPDPPDGSNCQICIVMCMYGLMLNVSNMSGDIFLNFGIMSALNIVSLLIFTFLNERVGRRLFLMGAAGVGGLACLATILPVVLEESDWILRGLSLGGRMFITTAMSGIYIMSPELFPTVLRSFGLGSCSMMSQLGGLVSPYVADLVVFGIAGVTTAGMVLVLPETRGRHLPETVRDAEMFGRRPVDEQRSPEDVEMKTAPLLTTDIESHARNSA